MRLILSREVEHALIATARAAWPGEAIGVLGGRGGAPIEVTALVPLPNRAASPDRFWVQPADFAAAEAALRRAGCTWLGFAHSHPGGSPVPSATDCAELWHGCAHVIVAVAADGLCTFGAWLFGHDRHPSEIAIARGSAVTPTGDRTR